MKARIVRAIFILMCSIWFGISFLMLGINAQSFLIAMIGLIIMFVGITTAYLHLTYRDGDNKYW